MSTKKNPALSADSNQASMIVKAGSPDNVDNTFQCSITQPNQYALRDEPSQHDRVFLHLCRSWAIGYDQCQWMVLRAKKRRDRSFWNPVAFIATTKDVLLRVIAEKGIRPTPEAETYIEQMPDKFREWLRIRTANQSCRCLTRVNGKKCRRNDAAQFGSSKREPVQ
jgi:hypothetical protein